MEDGKHTHYVSVYPKIHISIKGGVNSSDMFVEDRPSIVTKAFPSIFLLMMGHF